MRKTNYKLKRYLKVIKRISLPAFLFALIIGGIAFAVGESQTESSSFAYITYVGDTDLVETIKSSDLGRGDNEIYNVALMDINNNFDISTRTDTLNLKGDIAIASIKDSSTQPDESQKSKNYDLKFSVKDTYGIISSKDNNEDVYDKFLLAMDNKGNRAFTPLNLTIRNQNQKGTLTPNEVTVVQFAEKPTEDEIKKAVKNGSYIYNSDVPLVNKEGNNALDENGKLKEGKYKSIVVDEKSYNELNTAEAKDQTVKATITYLDGSTSDVEVIVKVTESVPTGVIDRGNSLPLMIIGLALLSIVFVVFKLRKKAHIDYE